MDDQGRIEWRKSTLSTTNGCVEVAVVGDRIAVRDSKQRGRGPVLKFTTAECGIPCEGTLMAKALAD